MYPPLEIGKTFRIVPPGFPEQRKGRLDLVMQRGAFGSGEHETTASCLGLLEDLPSLRDRRVLDLGSGTGILAIAAMKLGAAAALCVDLDPAAVATARSNCRLNGLEQQTDHVCGSLEDVPAAGFDLVLANIYGDILLALCRTLIDKTAPGGHLMLSGIAWEQNFAVRQSYLAGGCRLLRNRMLEEFSTLWLEKTRPETVP